MINQDEKLWAIAKRRAIFKKSLAVYFFVNSFLYIIWFITSGRYGGYFWPVWPILGWGLGIAMQYAGAYNNSAIFSAEKEYEKLKESEHNK